MRKARLKLEGETAVYHCIGRVVGGELLLGDVEKEKLRELIWLYAEFCGVEIITYCLMSNHFHLLVRVPEKVEISDRELVRRVRRLYGRKSALVQMIETHFKNHGAVPEDLRQALTRRMGDISFFMKELKQRYTRWHNQQTNRFGTLWAERFKSVIVEDEAQTVAAVAGYIDLNPVRAGLVQDSKDYRFCGLAEALAGGRKAQQGIASFHPSGSWNSVARTYREHLFLRSAASGHSGKAALEKETIRRLLEQGAELAQAEVLRLRIRYFSDGLVLGSQAFIERLFNNNRHHFGAKRKDGARRLKALGKALNDLRVARDLRVGAVG